MKKILTPTHANMIKKYVGTHTCAIYNNKIVYFRKMGEKKGDGKLDGGGVDFFCSCQKKNDFFLCKKKTKYLIIQIQLPPPSSIQKTVYGKRWETGGANHTINKNNATKNSVGGDNRNKGNGARAGGGCKIIIQKI